MNRRNLQRIAVGLSLAVGSVSAFARAADVPATDAPAHPEAQREAADVIQDMQMSGQELHQVLASSATLTDPAKRSEAAPKVVPILKKMIGYVGELKKSQDPQGKKLGEQVAPQLQTFLSLFGDADATAALEQQAKSSDAGESADGRGALLMVSWIKSAGDAAAQEKLVADADTLAKANADDDRLTGVLTAMTQIGPASPELARKIGDVAAGMNTRTARMMKAAAAPASTPSENQPLVVEGVRYEGGKLSTADWKGKVVLVEFWATWCPTCRKDMPRVEKAYQDYHAKGLEVVGVSCDDDAKDLDEFLKKNPGMAWPQLFDVKHPGWPALATSYGIKVTPTMYLIDRKGVLRDVSAADNFEEMIPKLIDEKTE